jgi:hypothetical protein
VCNINGPNIEEKAGDLKNKLLCNLFWGHIYSLRNYSTTKLIISLNIFDSFWMYWLITPPTKGISRFYKKKEKKILNYQKEK